MSAIAHLHDPQRDSIIDLVEQIRDLSNNILRPEPPCFLCRGDADPCFWHRPYTPVPAKGGQA